MIRVVIGEGRFVVAVESAWFKLDILGQLRVRDLNQVIACLVLDKGKLQVVEPRLILLFCASFKVHESHIVTAHILPLNQLAKRREIPCRLNLQFVFHCLANLGMRVCSQ